MAHLQQEDQPSVDTSEPRSGVNHSGSREFSLGIDSQTPFGSRPIGLAPLGGQDFAVRNSIDALKHDALAALINDNPDASRMLKPGVQQEFQKYAMDASNAKSGPLDGQAVEGDQAAVFESRRRPKSARVVTSSVEVHTDREQGSNKATTQPAKSKQSKSTISSKTWVPNRERSTVKSDSERKLGVTIHRKASASISARRTSGWSSRSFQSRTDDPAQRSAMETNVKGTGTIHMSTLATKPANFPVKKQENVTLDSIENNDIRILHMGCHDWACKCLVPQTVTRHSFGQPTGSGLPSVRVRRSYIVPGHCTLVKNGQEHTVQPPNRPSTAPAGRDQDATPPQGQGVHRKTVRFQGHQDDSHPVQKNTRQQQAHKGKHVEKKSSDFVIDLSKGPISARKAFLVSDPHWRSRSHTQRWQWRGRMESHVWGGQGTTGLKLVQGSPTRKGAHWISV